MIRWVLTMTCECCGHERRLSTTEADSIAAALARWGTSEHRHPAENGPEATP